ARLWHAETGALQMMLEGHTEVVTGCAFSPGGKRVVTASGDNTARLWDAETGALQTTLEGHTYGVTSCAFSPDGKRIVTASGRKRRAAASPLLMLRDRPALVTGGRCAAFSYKTARLWNAETGALDATLEGHTCCVTCCAFSPYGMRVATASYDKTARLWNVGPVCS
ncbi:WD40-repeat-containing domain protein, partial [Pelagophyceae sp. CCMP2097]